MTQAQVVRLATAERVDVTDGRPGQPLVARLLVADPRSPHGGGDGHKGRNADGGVMFVRLHVLAISARRVRVSSAPDRPGRC